MNKFHFFALTALIALPAGAAAAALVIVIPAVLQASRSDTLGFWGAIIGSTTTLGAAAVAWVAAQRQIRLNALTIARDRAERDIPGLRRAISFMEPAADIVALDERYSTRCVKLANYLQGKNETLADLFTPPEHKSQRLPIWRLDMRSIIEGAIPSAPPVVKEDLAALLSEWAGMPALQESNASENQVQSQWARMIEATIETLQRLNAKLEEAQTTYRAADREIGDILGMRKYPAYFRAR